MISLKFDFLYGVSFPCYVFIFVACCALPLPVQGPHECRQHLSGAFIQPTEGLMLSAGWHRSDTFSNALGEELISGNI